MSDMKERIMLAIKRLEADPIPDGDMFMLQYEVNLRKELKEKFEALYNNCATIEDVYSWLVNYEYRYAFHWPVKRKYQTAFEKIFENQIKIM